MRPARVLPSVYPSRTLGGRRGIQGLVPEGFSTVGGPGGATSLSPATTGDVQLTDGPRPRTRTRRRGRPPATKTTEASDPWCYPGCTPTSLVERPPICPGPSGHQDRVGSVYPPTDRHGLRSPVTGSPVLSPPQVTSVGASGRPGVGGPGGVKPVTGRGG